MPTAIDNLKVAVGVEGLFQNILDIGAAGYAIGYHAVHNFTDGNADNKVETLFSDIRTLTASSSENLDLAGSLVDAFGNTLTFTKVKAIIVVADGGNTNDVLVGGAASNGFASWVGDATDVVKVKPGGMFCLTAPKSAGLAVTASTGDILKIANSSSGSSVTYTIIIVGTDS